MRFLKRYHEGIQLMNFWFEPNGDRVQTASLRNQGFVT